MLRPTHRWWEIDSMAADGNYTCIRVSSIFDKHDHICTPLALLSIGKVTKSKMASFIN